MVTLARLKNGETLGDRIIKVDHAGEHGAVCVYRMQRLIARWRAPHMLTEIDDFIAHEKRHRSAFAAELTARNRPRCRSYALCAIGGGTLGLITGLAGANAIAATTVAIESVVLRHMYAQIITLEYSDPAAARLLRNIIIEEQEHHDKSAERLPNDNVWQKIITPIVTSATEAVIWLGMRL